MLYFSAQTVIQNWPLHCHSSLTTCFVSRSFFNRPSLYSKRILSVWLLEIFAFLIFDKWLWSSYKSLECKQKTKGSYGIPFSSAALSSSLWETYITEPQEGTHLWVFKPPSLPWRTSSRNIWPNLWAMHAMIKHVFGDYKEYLRWTGNVSSTEFIDFLPC